MYQLHKMMVMVIAGLAVLQRAVVNAAKIAEGAEHTRMAPPAPQALRCTAASWPWIWPRSPDSLPAHGLVLSAAIVGAHASIMTMSMMTTALSSYWRAHCTLNTVGSLSCHIALPVLLQLNTKAERGSRTMRLCMRIVRSSSSSTMAVDLRLRCRAARAAAPGDVFCCSAAGSGGMPIAAPAGPAAPRFACRAGRALVAAAASAPSL